MTDHKSFFFEKEALKAWIFNTYNREIKGTFSSINMPGLSLLVSLAEVLEVRDGPLNESEMWATIFTAVHTLKSYFEQGKV